MHYPGHERDAFINWVDEGFPWEAAMEIDYTPVKIHQQDFLRRFAVPGCTDIVPGDTCRQIAQHIDYAVMPDGVSGLTYAAAASVILVQLDSGDRAAGQYLARILGDYE